MPTQPSRRALERAADFETIDVAAVRLSTSPIALRARCRRTARKKGDTILAVLGAGVVAYKFGRSWRVRFPEAT